MKIDGVLKAHELRVGRLVIDWLKETVDISALAGLINTTDGQTIAWTKAKGVWADDTREAIRKARELVERDIIRNISDGAGTTPETRGKGLKVGGGLGEFLDGDDDAPSI